MHVRQVSFFSSCANRAVQKVNQWIGYDTGDADTRLSTELPFFLREKKCEQRDDRYAAHNEMRLAKIIDAQRMPVAFFRPRTGSSWTGWRFRLAFVLLNPSVV